jgi:hypothetical protein
MPSPFPGMDPWLENEEFFGDLHGALIIYLREALNAVLPSGYRAISSTLVWVDDASRREPDVSLLHRGRKPSHSSGTLDALPGLMTVGDEPSPELREEPYLEIHFSHGKRLVTAFEVLSPSNKRSGTNGRKTYLDKQEEFRLGSVNLVEVDLLRGGAHTTAVRLPKLQQLAGPFDYHVSVRVAGTPDRLHAAPIKLADRLPTIGIPLDRGVPPITVDLQPLLDRAYDTGKYAEAVRYERPPDPPLTPEQAEWAAGVLRAKGVVA